MENIDFTAVTACGECCSGCSKKESGICKGCVESDGHCEEWAQSQGCPIHKCAREHGVQFCGLCEEFPCKWLVQKVVWRPNVVEELTALAGKYEEWKNYIHPSDVRIENFINVLGLKEKSLEQCIRKLLEWFDSNVSYTRLNAPFYPLQRSDLDVLEMKAGTCGDYANLIVSVLTAMKFQAKYAYVSVDCYGNPQDHICAAVWNENRWILVDATLPYRKWHGFDCGHREYELLGVEVFLRKMKKEEEYWTEQAERSGDKSLAGLYYAPWIHDHVIRETEDVLESVFYLLVIESVEKYQVYVNLLIYERESASSPIMCRIQDGKAFYRFSINVPKNIWDDEQYSKEYERENIPEEYKNAYLAKFTECMDEDIKAIENAIKSAR